MSIRVLVLPCARCATPAPTSARSPWPAPTARRAFRRAPRSAVPNGSTPRTRLTRRPHPRHGPGWFSPTSSGADPSPLNVGLRGASRSFADLHDAPTTSTASPPSPRREAEHQAAAELVPRSALGGEATRASGRQAVATEARSRGDLARDVEAPLRRHQGPSPPRPRSAASMAPYPQTTRDLIVWTMSNLVWSSMQSITWSNEERMTWDDGSKAHVHKETAQRDYAHVIFPWQGFFKKVCSSNFL
ncbi:hypothetical protein EJB05_43748, partial [Eragrostis curvula]